MKRRIACLAALVLTAASTAFAEPAIETLPPRVAGEPLEMRVERLKPSAPYSFHAVRGAPGADRVWLSSFHFLSNAAGEIDFAKDAPVGGYAGFSGADPWGPLWSMDQVLRSSLPPAIANSVADLASDDLRIFVLENDVPVRILQTKYLARPPGAQEIDLDAKSLGFHGTLVLPPAAPTPSRTPAVVVWGGSGGGRPLDIANYLAAHGYAALAVEYFTFDASKAGPLFTDHIRETPLEIFENAIRWIKRHPRVDSSRVAVLGGSRGSESALLVGLHLHLLVRGVVAHRASDFTFSSLNEHQTAPEASSWTFRGRSIPYLRFLDRAGAPHYIDELAFLEAPQAPIEGFLTHRFRQAYEVAYANCARFMTASDYEAARIKTENVRTPVFMSAGTDDQMWPSDAAVRRARALRASRPWAHLDRYVIAEGSGHANPIPGQSTLRSAYSVMPFSFDRARFPKSVWVNGGDAQTNHAATVKIWAETLGFLEDIFRDDNPDRR